MGIEPVSKRGGGAQAPTVVGVEKTKRTRCCCVFEGFMDFLSYKALEERGGGEITQQKPRDCIILNSTSITLKAVSFIDV